MTYQLDDYIDDLEIEYSDPQSLEEDEIVVIRMEEYELKNG